MNMKLNSVCSVMPDSGGKKMIKKSMKAFVMIIVFILFPVNSFSAEAIKLRHVTSVYSDNTGGGLSGPEGIACRENLFVIADTGNNRILRYSFEDDIIKGGEEIKAAELSYPIKAQLNSKGEIFALDGKNRRIVRIGAEGSFKGYISPEGSPSQSFIPKSFKIDNKDNIYILDILSGRVMVLNPEGKLQRQIKLPEDYGFISDLAIDSKGNIFLLDSVNAVVFFAAEKAEKFSPLAKNIKEYVNFPTSIAVDKRGIIYLLDQNGGVIVMLGPEGDFKGHQLSSGWKDGLLRYPSDLCINEKGYLFIADRNNNRVQIFTTVK